LTDVSTSAAWGVPTVVVAVAAVSVLAESVAVSTQAPVTLTLSALKVATPAAATAATVPPSAHGDVIVMVSVAPVPEVTTLLLTSSTETLKVVSTVLAVATAAGGAVVKATCVAVPASTAMAVLVAVVKVLAVSVATREHEAPVLIETAANVATPATAVAVKVPVRVHVDEIATASVEPSPDWIVTPLLSSIETAKEGRTVPAVVVADGSGVKPTLVGVVVATEIEGLGAVANTSVLSVAVRTQLSKVVTVILIALKVATPPLAVTGPAAPPTVHPVELDERVTWSAELATTLPYWSSIETAVVKFTALVTAVGGCVVKPI